MRKQLMQFLAVSLFLCTINTSAMSNHSLGGGGNGTNWYSMAKALCQVVGVAWVVGGLNDIEKKANDQEISQENYDARKFALLVVAGAVVASFTNDWGESMKRWATFCGLLGLTHVTANNKNIVSGLRSIPFAGPLLTDNKIDNKSDNKTTSSMGAMIRYISFYMTYRTLGRGIFPGLNSYLLV